jgi:hypothetical protein
MNKSISPMPPNIGVPLHRTYSPGMARFLTQTRLAEQRSGEHPYGYAFNNPITYVDPDGKRPQKPGKITGLPTELTKCLSARAQKILREKLKDDWCASAIKRACGQSGLDALKDRKIVPKWEFKKRCGKPDWAGACEFDFPGHKKGEPYFPNIPCRPKGICITNATCKGNSHFAACVVIWELGNACGCKNTGYDPHESTAQSLATACECEDITKPGGIIYE